MSLTTRNVWKRTAGSRSASTTIAETSWKIAQQEHVDFVDVSALVAEQYEKLGDGRHSACLPAKEPVHLDIPGAFLNAQVTVSGLKGLPDAPVSKYLSYLGLMVEAELSLPYHLSGRRTSRM